MKKRCFIIFVWETCELNLLMISSIALTSFQLWLLDIFKLMKNFLLRFSGQYRAGLVFNCNHSTQCWGVSDILFIHWAPNSITSSLQSISKKIMSENLKSGDFTNNLTPMWKPVVVTQWRMFATFPIVVTISCLGGDGGLTSFSTAAVSKITAIRMLTDFRSSWSVQRYVGCT